MFSTTPRSSCLCWFEFALTATPRAATNAAVAWGVVTRISLLCGGSFLVNVPCHVPCSRRQMDQQIIKVSPVNFTEEVLAFSPHGSAPNHRRIVLNKKSHGHDFHAETFHRQNHLTNHHGTRFDAHHVRNAESVYIGNHCPTFFPFRAMPRPDSRSRSIFRHRLFRWTRR